MHIEKLIKMANQIGAFFEAMPDRTQAMKDIASHIQRTWDPAMRATLLAHLDTQAEADIGLKPIVDEAVRSHRKALEAPT